MAEAEGRRIMSYARGLGHAAKREGGPSSASREPRETCEWGAAHVELIGVEFRFGPLSVRQKGLYSMEYSRMVFYKRMALFQRKF